MTTDLVFDLGTSAATIKSGGATENNPLGTDSSDTCQLCKVTDDVFGIVTSLEIVCLEGASDGDMTDFSITKSTNQTELRTPAAADAVITGSAGTNVVGGTVGKAEGGNNTGVIASLGQHTMATFNDEALKDQNLYLSCGSTAGTASEAAIGRIAISADNFNVNQLEDGKTRIAVINTNGTVTTSTVVSTAKGSSGMSTNAGTIGTSDVTTAAHFAESLATCLNAPVCWLLKSK